jgi:sodium-dependent dicarboxylate transporter 2/3/5
MMASQEFQRTDPQVSPSTEVDGSTATTTREKATAVKPSLIIVGAIVLALLGYWLAREAINEMAARALAIFVIAAVFWSTEVMPTFATAFVVLGLNILLLANEGGLADPISRLLRVLGLQITLPQDARSLQASVFLPLAKDIILLFIGGFLLSAAITKHGIHRVIAGKVLRPFARTPLTLLYGVLGISAIFSMWMSNTATAAMMIAISMPFVDAIPAHNRFRRAILLAVAFGANLGGLGTPIGTPPNAIAFGALNAAGYNVTFLRWMLVAVPLELILLAGVGLLLFVLYRPSEDLQFAMPAAPSALSTGAKATLVILAITILLWLTSGQHGMHAGAIALLAAAALTALRMLDRRDVDTIDWDIIILMWGGLSLGIALQETGLVAYLGNIDLDVIPADTWVVGAVIAMLGMVVSTFMSNTAAAALLVPMAMGLSIPGSEQLAMLAAFACSFAMAMPVSTPPNAIVFGTGQISVSEMIRTGGLISISGGLIPRSLLRLILG